MCAGYRGLFGGLNSHSSQSLYPRNDAPKLARPSSPRNPVTARISLITLIKLRMPFFPSCIIVFRDSLSPGFLRPRLAQPCRSPRLRSLTTELIDSSRRKRSHGVHAPAKRQLRTTTPCPLSDILVVSQLEAVLGKLAGMYVTRHRMRFLAKKARVPNEPNPTIGHSPATPQACNVHPCCGAANPACSRLSAGFFASAPVDSSRSVKHPRRETNPILCQEVRNKQSAAPPR
jgi:hypothetical protein